MKILMAGATALLLAGCATVTRGTTDQVQVVSTPSEARVTTSVGHACASTPCTFEVSRKSEFIVTVHKDGYQEATVPVSTRVAGSGAAGFAGNLLLGDIVGTAAEAAAAEAALEHYPNPVNVTLTPVAAVQPKEMTSKKKRVSTPVASAATLRSG